MDNTAKKMKFLENLKWETSFFVQYYNCQMIHYSVEVIGRFNGLPRQLC